jgi:ABC-2 type transport system ATP-binding protein
VVRPPLVSFDGVTLAYGGASVLEGVSLLIEEGDAVGLVGPNGSGKTTFLRALLGLLAPQRGKIERDSARRFAYVPQAEDLNFFWPLTVREAVELAAKSRRVFGRADGREKALAARWMERTGVAPIAGKLLREVSGGQRQRTILAQALSEEPDVLVLDEPTKGFDPVNRRLLMEIIDDCQKQGATVVMVTHQMEEVERLCDRILLLKDGRAKEYGTLASVRKKYDGAHMDDIFVKIYEETGGDE